MAEPNYLTIDVDYAFSPSISEYDDYVVGNSIGIEKQLHVIKDLGLEAIENPIKVKEIKNCLDLIKKNAPVHIIKYHHEILDCLPTSTNFKLYNIDHHHDIFYPGWHDKEKLDEGNWVYHLKGCTEYTWIRNTDSENMPQHSLEFVVNEMFLDDNTIKKLPQFDSVIFCESPHWTGGKGISTIDKLINELMKKCL